MLDVTSGGDTGDGAGTGTTGTWRDQLPADLRTHEAFAELPGLGDLAKTHLSLREQVASAIPKPKENATDAEMAAYYKAVGRPDTMEGYEIAIPENLPGAKEMADWFKEAAYKRGLPKKAVEEMAKEYLDNYGKQTTAIHQTIEAAKTEAETKLKGEWGDKYQENVDLAKKTAQKIGGDEVIGWLEATGIGNEPIVIKFMQKLGTLISEDAFTQGSTPAPEIKRTAGGQPLLSFPSMEK